jgi:hypothetical protein
MTYSSNQHFHPIQGKVQMEPEAVTANLFGWCKLSPGDYLTTEK